MNTAGEAVKILEAKVAGGRVDGGRVDGARVDGARAADRSGGEQKKEEALAPGCMAFQR